MKTYKDLREEVNDGVMIIPVPSGGGKFYDENGNYQMRIDSNNKVYNSGGNYQGKMDMDDRVYDEKGNLIGEWK